jgi:hypothetical protein
VNLFKGNRRNPQKKPFSPSHNHQQTHKLLNSPLQTKCLNLRILVWPRGSTTWSVKCSSSRRKSCRSSRRYQKFYDASTISIAIHHAYHHQRPPPALMKQQSRIIEVSSSDHKDDDTVVDDPKRRETNFSRIANRTSQFTFHVPSLMSFWLSWICIRKSPHTVVFIHNTFGLCYLIFFLLSYYSTLNARLTTVRALDKKLKGGFELALWLVLSTWLVRLNSKQFSRALTVLTCSMTLLIKLTQSSHCDSPPPPSRQNPTTYNFAVTSRISFRNSLREVM